MNHAPRRVGLIVASLLALAGAAAAEPAPLSPELARKLDTRLLPAVLAGGEEPVSVWLELADKGEQGPADLIARLQRAEASLTPRALARRLRAHVEPLVDYRDLPVHAPYVELLAARGLTPVGASRWLNRVAVRVPAGRLPEVASLSCVARIAPVERMHRSEDPPVESTGGAAREARPLRATAVDYGQTAQQLVQIGVPSLHDSGYTGAGVLICVLDEGFNWYDKHEALRDIPIPAGFTRDFVRGVESVQDTTGAGFRHGTAVLGVIAGRKIGTYVGAAYGADIALARTETTSSETPQEMVNWGMGAEWADSLGADIISSSLGYFDFDPGFPDYTYANMDGHTTVVSRAAEIAASKGILVVNSVGNEGATAWHFLIAPSDVHGDSVIAVGAVDAAGMPAGFSSFGPSPDGRVKPDVAARGVANPIVGTTGNWQAYSTASGTSFSQPLIAGLAACLMQARPVWTPRDVARAIRLTASRAANPDYRVGYGIANGGAALSYDPTASVPPGHPPAPRIRMAGPNPVDGAAPARVWVSLTPGGLVAAAATVIVHDAQGRRIRSLWSGVLTSDSPVAVTWDGRDDGGREAGRGLYFITLEASGERSTIRLVLLR